VMENLEAFIDSLTDGEPEEATGYIYPVSAKKKIGVGELKNQLFKRLQRNGFRNPFEFIR
jgi:hypothetical protein